MPRERFARLCPSVIAGKTGRHTYTEWDQVLIGAGAAHPAMNPYNMPANAECRKTYSRDMCARSLDILNRTVMVATHPKHGERGNRRHHSQHRHGGTGGAWRASPGRGGVPRGPPVDVQKFDIMGDDQRRRRTPGSSSALRR